MASLPPSFLKLVDTTPAGEVERALRPLLAAWGQSPIPALRLLQALGEGRRPRLALCTLETLRRSSFQVNTFHCNTVISVAGRQNQWPAAVSLLNGLKAWQLRPTESTCNAVIGAWRISGLWSQSINILRRMREAVLETDCISFNAAAAAATTGAWQLALSLAEEDPVGAGTSITACEVAKRWELALQLFRSLPDKCIVVNRVMCNSLISVCASSQRWEAALLLLSLMPSLQLRTDIMDVNSCIAAATRGAQWMLALGILGSALHVGLTFSEVTYNAALGAAEAGLQWGSSLVLLGPRASWEARLRTALTGRAWRLARAQLQAMLWETPRPPPAAFHVAMGPMAWREALQVLDDMNEEVRTAVSWNTAISACGRDSKWQVVLMLVHKMLQQNLVPNDVTLVTAISACQDGSQWSTALELLFSLQTGQMSLSAVNSALGACETSSCWQWALTLFWSMPELALTWDEVSYSAVIDSCAKGAWHELVGLLSQWQQRCFRDLSLHEAR